VEVSGEVGGPCLAVIGIGVNVALPSAVLVQLNQSATDLQSTLGYIPSRNQTAAALLNELVQILPEFEQRGFAVFQSAWMEHDGLRGRNVDVAVPAGVVSGRAEGVGADGALLVRVGGKVQRFHSGEVSVRLAR
jgi:BirA family biotin operon repressor/biotin-[acetyl-CoA-carboxylase] ligase